MSRYRQGVSQNCAQQHSIQFALIEASDSEPTAVKGKTSAPAPAKAPVPVKKPVKSKWEGEDEEDDAPAVRVFLDS